MRFSARSIGWLSLGLALVLAGGCGRDPNPSKSPDLRLAIGGPATPLNGGLPLGVTALAGPRPGRSPAGAMFADLPDRGGLLAFPPGMERKEGAYTWHQVKISEEHALRAIVDGTLRVATPGGGSLEFQYERHIEHPTGDWTWVGRLHGAEPGRQAILTFGADAVYGTIDQRQGLPLRISMRDKVSWLIETDPVGQAAVSGRGLRSGRGDYLLPPRLSVPPSRVMSLRGGTSRNGTGPTVSSSTSAVETNSATTVDVLVGYTPGFASAQGGFSQAVTRINFLVDVTNEAYIDSQVDLRIRLVHSMQVAYPDATDNGDALQKMTGYDTSLSGEARYTTPDPAFDDLRAARDAHGADLVSLVRQFNDPENDGCGIAWLIGGGQATITPGYEYFGYSVVSDGQDVGSDGKTYYCRDETFAHELAHNMGSAHDVETAKGEDGVLGSEEYGRYPYSFGYRTAPGSGDFYTIMAYREDRPSGIQQTPYRIFSNPRIAVCGGLPCGSAAADNARSLGEASPDIATFRASAGPARKTRMDVDGDGNGDLLWFNAAFQRVAYWAMAGNGIVRHGGQMAGGDYSAITAGDYDGDGRMDVVWRGLRGDLQLWTSNGTTFDWMPFLDDTGLAGSPYVNYPIGWNLVASKDVDGDGRDDLVWYNPGSQVLAYWIMSGNRISRHGGQGAGGSYSILTTGDYNGDGRMDVVWKGPQGDLQLWFSNGTTFDWQPFKDNTGLAGSPHVYYPGGWSLMASSDMDADGRTDLIWYNPASQRVAYWIMGAGNITRHGGQASGGNYSILTVGDFNGDARTDLVWRGPGDDLQMWFSNGTTFDWKPFVDSTGLSGAPYVHYPTGWSMIRSP